MQYFIVVNVILRHYYFTAVKHLSFVLQVDDPKERLQVVGLLSRMFSEKGSNLAVENSTLWNCFLGRFNDIDSEVVWLIHVLYRP